MSDAALIEAVVASIKGSRKYRAVSEATVRSLVAQALPEHRKRKALDKAVRKRLHGIVADHLGDPDYQALAPALEQALREGDGATERSLCEAALHRHLSTRERWPYLAEFYRAIFEHTGEPGVVLDLACALGPLALPWMGLPARTRYLGYDIHEERVSALDRYLRARGQAGGVQLRDIVLQPPTERATVALLLKELHRLLRNYPGRIDGDWLASIPARFLAISLPSVSAHGGRRLAEPYRAMMATMVQGRPWSMHERLFEHELLFIVDTEPA